MPRWILRFEAAITATIDASTVRKAVEAAERILDAIGIDGVRMNEAADCSIVAVHVARDEQVGAKLQN